MGFLDSPIFTSLIKVSEGTLSGTGNLLDYANKNGYNTLLLVLKITEGTENTGDFGVSVTGGSASNKAALIAYDEHGLVYENLGYPKYLISKSNFTDYDSVASPFTGIKLFYFDITSIDNVKARIEYCNGTFTFDYSIYISRGNFAIHDYKPIQKLGSFVRIGNGTTKTGFGGIDAMASIPAGFKYVFVDVIHTNSEGTPVDSNFDATMYFCVKRHFNLSTYPQQYTLEKIVATATNAPYATSDYQEVKGNNVLCHVNFDTAPASGDKIYITYFGVR